MKLKPFQEFLKMSKEKLDEALAPIRANQVKANADLEMAKPDLMGGRTSLTLYPGAVPMAENVFINVKNRSHSITANVDVPKDGAEGVIIAQAGRFSGWSLYVKNGRASYAYNWLGRETYKVADSAKLPEGPVTIRMDFAYDGGGGGKGCTVTLTVNGRKVAEGRVNNTLPNVFSTDEGVSDGSDDETVVTDDYKPRNNQFTGKLGKIVVEVK